MRITTGSLTLEGNTLEEIQSLIALLPSLAPHTLAMPREQALATPTPSDRERALRDEYALTKGLTRARFTPGMLGGRSTLEFLEAWKAGEIVEEQGESNQSTSSNDPIDLDDVPV